MVVVDPAPAPEGRNPSSPARRGRRTPLLVGAAVTAVALVVVALVVTALTRPAAVLDRGTPEGTVQAYVAALVAGDSVGAAALLAASSPCTATDLDRVRLGDGTAVDLVGVVPQGPDRALVHVRAGSTADPLGGSQEEVTFRLVRLAPGWRIDGVPWPLYDCTGG